MHQPIKFRNLCLSLPHKICFADFSGQISIGNRIAIIGANGAGKSTLLNYFAGLTALSDGEINRLDPCQIGYVPQIIHSNHTLSGAQRFNKALSAALAYDPALLLLDEPTNHLDNYNRSSLMRMLRGYSGTLIVVTHDIELLNAFAEIIWHIDNGKVAIFTGRYSDYQREISIQRKAITAELTELNYQKIQAHQALMKEQSRAKSSRLRGEKNIRQKKWPTIVSDTKARNAQETSGKKKAAINHKRQELFDRLADCRIHEIIQPKFIIKGMETNQTLLTITDGFVSYQQQEPILNNLSLSLKSRQRIALRGNNGSGKSTLVKAIMNDNAVVKTGNWMLPKLDEIGYLDQHYSTLSDELTVFDTLSILLPDFSYVEIRKHLNDFLFRKNEEVNATVKTLSGGEKARLSLAQIAAIVPKLLILDEMTNNLDLETRNHVIQVLQHYPGSMLVISHDNDFLSAIGANDFYELQKGSLVESKAH